MPEFTYAHESFGWLVLAAGVMLIGLFGLLIRCPATAWWRFGGAAGLAGLAGWGWAQSWPDTVTFALAALAGFQALRAVFTLTPVRRAGAHAASLMARPRSQAGLLVAAGAAVAIWQVVHLDMAFKAEMAQSDELLRSLTDSVDLNLVPDRFALTDKGSTIPLFTPQSPDSVNASSERDHLRRLGYDLHLIQTSNADLQYNCHGWVFTGGRYWVRGNVVEQILTENGYKPVNPPRPDDIAIFRDDDGDVLHTALIRGVTSDGTVLLESKWGQLGRYLHNDTRHAYNRGSTTYYRSPRPGHLLRGLEYPRQAPVNLEE